MLNLRDIDDLEKGRKESRSFKPTLKKVRHAATSPSEPGTSAPAVEGHATLPASELAAVLPAPTPHGGAASTSARPLLSQPHPMTAATAHVVASAALRPDPDVPPEARPTTETALTPGLAPQEPPPSQHGEGNGTALHCHAEGIQAPGSSTAVTATGPHSGVPTLQQQPEGGPSSSSRPSTQSIDVVTTSSASAGAAAGAGTGPQHISPPVLPLVALRPTVDTRFDIAREGRLGTTVAEGGKVEASPGPSSTMLDLPENKKKRRFAPVGAGGAAAVAAGPPSGGGGDGLLVPSTDRRRKGASAGKASSAAEAPAEPPGGDPHPDSVVAVSLSLDPSAAAVRETVQPQNLLLVPSLDIAYDPLAILPLDIGPAATAAIARSRIDTPDAGARARVGDKKGKGARAQAAGRVTKPVLPPSQRRKGGASTKVASAPETGDVLQEAEAGPLPAGLVPSAEAPGPSQAPELPAAARKQPPPKSKASAAVRARKAHPASASAEGGASGLGPDLAIQAEQAEGELKEGQSSGETVSRS